MKLKNKLLPLVGVAATVATATPLALTSCKSNDNVELIDITDGTKATPTLPQMKSDTWMTQTQYTRAYIKDVKENPEIFKQDYIWGMYQNLVIDREGEYNYDYLRVGCSTPEFGVVNISYPGEPDVQYPTISFTYKVQFSRDEEIGGTSSYQLKSEELDMTVTLENIPLVISPYTDASKPLSLRNAFWIQLPSMDTQKYIWRFNLNPWSINYSYDLKQKITKLNPTGKTVEESEDTDSATIQKYTDLTEDFDKKMGLGFYSHHLAQITSAPEFVAHKIHAGTKNTPIEKTLTDKFAKVEHGEMVGLYLPQLNYDINLQNVSIELFAGYDDDLNPTGNVYAQQILPEGSTADAKYIKFTTKVLEYNTDQTTGWNGIVVPYEKSPYITYLFPEGTIVDSLDVESPIEPTSGKVGEEQFIFALPKSIVIQFTYKTTILGEEVNIKWNQQVWLSQDVMSIYVNFTA